MVIVQVGDLDEKQLDCLIYSLRSIELLLAFSSKLLFNCCYFVAYQVEMYKWPVCRGSHGAGEEIWASSAPLVPHSAFPQN